MIDRFVGEYSFLSNFHPSPIVYCGIDFKTVEHAYQAMKTMDRETRQAIANLTTPGQAKRAGRNVNLRKDWEEVRVIRMSTLLRRKFSIPKLRKKLQDTGQQELVEGNPWNDTFWGVCNKVGENQLGKLLMKIREEQ